MVILKRKEWTNCKTPYMIQVYIRKSYFFMFFYLTNHVKWICIIPLYDQERELLLTLYFVEIIPFFRYVNIIKLTFY